MNAIIEQIQPSFICEKPATERSIDEVEKAIGQRLPEEYRKFLLQSNGGNGFIGGHYLVLWKIEDLLQLNQEYQIFKYAPGLLAFASSGGGEGFAFSIEQTPSTIFQIPFIGISLADAIPVADSFEHLLKKMIHSDAPLF